MTNPSANKLLITFYGDDFTGSTASLECLAQAGARSALFLEPPSPERLACYPGLRALGVAGMTRSMTPEAMEAELRPALTALRALGAPHVHYKVCSTFDSSPSIGSIGRVIDLATGIFNAPFVPLLVAAPMLGRYCVFGNLFAQLGQQGEAFRLDRHPSMSRHPITPADESDLRRHLARQTAKRIALFDVLKLALPEADARAALETLAHERWEVVLFDVLQQEQLSRIGCLIDAYASPGRPLFSVGSSAVEEALSAHWAAKGELKSVPRWADPGPGQPVLVASGSCSPVTERQIAWGLEHGFAEVALDTASLVAGQNSAQAEQRATDETVRRLRAGHSVIVHTNSGNAAQHLVRTPEVPERSGLDSIAMRTSSARLFGGALGRIIRETAAQTHFRRLVIAGGDTSGYVARALGIEAVEMIGPLAPGAPLCRAHAPGSPADGLEISFKGGQIGGEDYFGIVARGCPDSNLSQTL